MHLYHIENDIYTISNIYIVQYIKDMKKNYIPYIPAFLHSPRHLHHTQNG